MKHNVGPREQLFRITRRLRRTVGRYADSEPTPVALGSSADGDWRILPPD